MDNLALILIATALVMLVLILGTLTFLIYRLVKQGVQKQQEAPEDPRYHPAIRERMKEAHGLKTKKREDLFCPNHPEEPGEVMCGICDHLFCKSCIKPFKNLHFCKEHLPLIMQNEWEEVFTLKTSSEDPETGVRLYDAKKRLFKEKDIPSFVETHYKINVEQDFIETYLVVFAKAKDHEAIRSNMVRV